jgi:dipeptidyl aminopeptidase/acylaminoacyl peptidase
VNERKPLVPGDLYRLAVATDPQCGLAGRIFYTLATYHEDGDESRTAIWSVAAGCAAPFTTGRHDRMPRLSPDGTQLAFVGERGDGKRVYVMATGGGEARPVTPAYDALTALAWRPDGGALAFAAVTPLDPATARIALDVPSGARHIRGLPFKSDDEGLLDGRRKHLFVYELASGDEPRRLTFGDFDVHAPAWSPNGKLLAFSAQIELPETALYEDLYLLDAAGGAPRKLTAGRGPSTWPAFSHDGREIAFLGHEHGDDGGFRYALELLVIPVDGGVPRSLSGALDRPAADYVLNDVLGGGGRQAPLWSADDGELLVLLASEGACSIVAFTRDGERHRIVAGGDRNILGFSAGGDGSLGFAFSTPLRPSELATIDRFGREAPAIDCNPWLAERALRSPRRLRPRAKDGTTLDLFILDPDEAKVAPYVLQVHGGPHFAYGFAFFFEFQMLASHGIGVGYGNPRGSQTYGHAFSDANVGDWGGVDASDVLDLCDALVANAPVDLSRLGLAGGSYGGFMTTWLLARSKRFACGISMRAVNDFVSEVGASDFGWFLEREVGASWADGGRKLFENSPMRQAAAIEAPLLVEHSERDYRCPIDQGEQLFTLLRRLGRGHVEFVRFAGDGHGLARSGKPRNRVLRLRAIAHWLIRYLRPAGIEPLPASAGALFAPLPTEASA